MKNLLSAICITAIILGVFGMLFFSKYKGTAISHAQLYFFGNMALIAIGAFGLKIIVGKQHTQKAKGKTNYIEIDVDLSKIDVLENKYFVENENYYYSKTPLLDLIDKGQNPKQHNEINQCRFEYTVNYNADTLTFVSPIINKDRETLMFKLLAQKQTKLYLDKDDYSNHYLDLGFLSKG